MNQSLYTREDAIANGDQVCLSDQYPELCQQLYRVPVYCSKAIWELITTSKTKAQLVLLNILEQSANTAKNKGAQCKSYLFKVTIPGADKKPDDFDQGNPTYDILAMVGPYCVNNPNMAVTILCPDDDDPIPRLVYVFQEAFSK